MRHIAQLPLRVMRRGNSIPLSEEHPSDEIARIEAEIEHLAAVRESCRKIILASRTAIALGSLVLIAALTELIRFDQVIMIGAITAVLGGLVGLGSNTTTLGQATERMRAAEARRSELIDSLEVPRVIEEPHAP